MSTHINTKRIARNTIMLYIRMLLIMVVTIYMSRVVLQALGIEDYGIYNVVAGAVVFLGFFNSALSMATQRFLNVELGKTGGGDLNRVFNMSINIHLIVGLIIILLAETVGLWLVNYALNIPPERLYAANWVFQCVIISTFFSVIQVPYNSAIFAYEKMDVFAYLSIFEVFFKLGLTYCLYWINTDKLILYSILMLGVQLLVFLLYSIYVSRRLDGCKFKLQWDKKLFKSISGFMGWNICGQTAQILTTQGVNMVANVFLGVVINAAIAITNQVNGALSMFVQNFQTSFRPQIMKCYAAEQLDDMKKLVYKASKSSFFLLYILSMPIMLNIDIILKVWLGTVPDYSGIFCKLLIWSSYIEAISLPLVMAIMATGHNKFYQIYVSIFISLNIFLTWFFLSIGFSPEIIYIVKIAVSVLVVVVRLYFARKQTGISIKNFTTNTILPVIKVITATLPFYLLISNYITNTTTGLKTIITILYFFLIIISVFFVGFTTSEKLFIKNFISVKISKRK